MAYNKFYKNKRKEGELWKSQSSPKELKEQELDPRGVIKDKTGDYNFGLRKNLMKAMSSSQQNININLQSDPFFNK